MTSASVAPLVVALAFSCWPCVGIGTYPATERQVLGMSTHPPCVCASLNWAPGTRTFSFTNLGPGSWASFAKEFPGYRGLFLDRPGWGMSTPLDYGRGDYRSLITGVMKGVLDGLHLDTVAAVGHSIGDVWALGLAERHPSRSAGWFCSAAGRSYRKSRHRASSSSWPLHVRNPRTATTKREAGEVDDSAERARSQR